MQDSSTGELKLIIDEEMSPKKIHGQFVDETHDVTTDKGRFLIVKELGKGSCGKRYQVRDTCLGGIVVLTHIAEYDSGDTPGIPTSILNVINYTHPSISSMLGVFHNTDVDSVDAIFDGGYYLVSKFSSGTPLNEWRKLFLGSKVKTQRALDICSQVAIALDNAHQNGFIHGSLSLDTILLDIKEHVTITDFGYESKSINSVISADSKVTLSTSVAPEQLVHDIDILTSDIYALAAILYELISGRELFDGFSLMTEEEKCNAILHSNALELSEFSAPQWDLLRSALTKDPQLRPSSCTDFILELSSTFESKQITSNVLPKVNRNRKRQLLRHCKVASGKLAKWSFIAVIAFFVYSNFEYIKYTASNIISNFGNGNNRYSDSQSQSRILRGNSAPVLEKEGLSGFLDRLINGTGFQGNSGASNAVIAARYNEAISKFERAESMVSQGEGERSLSELRAVLEQLSALQSEVPDAWMKKALGNRIADCEDSIYDLECFLNLRAQN